MKNQLTGKDPDAGKDRGQEEKGATEDEVVDGITYSMDMSFNKLWEMVKDREAWRVSVHGVAKSWTRLTEQQQKAHHPISKSLSHIQYSIQ